MLSKPSNNERDGILEALADALTVFDRGSGRLYELAQSLGYYAQNDIQVRIVPGQTAYGMAKLVSMEDYSTCSIGSADSSVVLLARAGGLPIKCLGAISRDAVTIASRGEAGIRKPEDLEGKRIGVAQGTGEALLLPVLLKMHRVDLNETSVAYFGTGLGKDVEQGPLALVRGAIDAYGGYVGGSITDAIHLAKQRGKTIDLMRYSDHGISTYGYGIICNESMLREREDLVGRFFRSTCSFFKFVVENPRRTVDLILKDSPGTSRELAETRISAFTEELVRPEVLRNGMGDMDLAVWRDLQKLLLRYGRTVDEVDLKDFVDLRFVSKDSIPSIPKR